MEQLENVGPQKQDVIVKGPRELSNIYEDKPTPKWPKQMDYSAFPSPGLSNGGKDVDVAQNFSRGNLVKDPIDLSLAVAEIVYEADFLKGCVCYQSIYMIGE